MKRTFARLFSYLRAYRFQLVLVLIGIVLSAGANIAGTYMLKPIINDYIVPWIGSADPDFSGLIGQLAKSHHASSAGFTPCTLILIQRHYSLGNIVKDYNLVF